MSVNLSLVGYSREVCVETGLLRALRVMFLIKVDKCASCPFPASFSSFCHSGQFPRVYGSLPTRFTVGFLSSRV